MAARRRARVCRRAGIVAAGLALGWVAGAGAQAVAVPDERLWDELRTSLEALAELREDIAEEQIPLSQRLHKLEVQQIDARHEHALVKSRLDQRQLDARILQTEIQSREQEKTYLTNLLDEYIRNLETRLHIAELPQYQDEVTAAHLALEHTNLKPEQVFARQIDLVGTSVTRLEDLLGGTRFAGRASGEDGLFRQGTFVCLGPVAYFASEDGSLAGVAEQRLGSLEAAVVPFADPEQELLTADLVHTGMGTMPFDASLGDARRVEATRQTLGEHIVQGGVVMVPILCLAVVAFLVILAKGLELSRVRMPQQAQVRTLLHAVGRGDPEQARAAAQALPGPAGVMLSAGTVQLNAPKDLVEEVMFETLLATRARLHRALPFVAVAAASAPLLGLLGTVTGIINTFELLSVYGTGDVKTLSAGISEALVTTEFGLIVAIPALLAHAFLLRRTRVITDRMEQLAIAFLCELEKARAGEETTP